ncbi:hypothetical protein ANCCEY_00420 [Ancylostoma ceylanicum]|uniref:Uncharacterized protein n=1 Tax=Ancylostoma ceylanicum TaxID=53326 RepID=A0A0D6MAA3_9BILA|nr:hypothetical protein ANCCEY_00420 [Ancylostoma ceylanicum]
MKPLLGANMGTGSLLPELHTSVTETTDNSENTHIGWAVLPPSPPSCLFGNLASDDVIEYNTWWSAAWLARPREKMPIVTPGILKSRLKPFFDICLDDVTFEDRLYNYKLSRKSQLLTHIAKIRLYYRYLSPFNKVEPKVITVEGALDIHVNAEGYIYKIVNRKITASDREGAKVMETIKAEQEEARRKAEEKELRRQAEELVEEEKRRGTL